MKILRNILFWLIGWVMLASPCWAYLDLTTNTWMTRDPMGQAAGPNPYTYVSQNPWTKFDPNGLQEVIPWFDFLKLGGAEEYTAPRTFQPRFAPPPIEDPAPTPQAPNPPRMADFKIPPAPVPVTSPQQQSSGAKPSGSSQDDKNKQNIVWRGGGQTNQTFTPRPDKDTDPDSDKRGLSTFRDPNRAAPNTGSTAQGIDLNKIDRSKFDVIETPDGHVSIRPKTQQELEEWAQSRPNANTTPHPYTSDVRSAATGVTYKNPGGSGESSAPASSPQPPTSPSQPSAPRDPKARYIEI